MIDAEEFTKLFKLPQNSWASPMKLIDTKYGFSVYRSSNMQGFKSLFRVFIDPEELKSENLNKILTITAAFGKENDDGSITISSTEFERGINWPINIISNTEFRLNLLNGNVTFKGKNITTFEVLEKVYKAHLTPTYRWHSIKLKLYLHKSILKLIEIIFTFFAFFNFLLTNEKLKIYSNLREDERSRGFFKENISQSPGEIIDIFGIKVPVSVAFIYSVVHLIVYSYLFYKHLNYKFIENIFENNFLALMYAIFSIALFKIVLPISVGLKPFFRIIQKFYFKVAAAKMHIKIK